MDTQNFEKFKIISDKDNTFVLSDGNLKIPVENLKEILKEYYNNINLNTISEDWLKNYNNHNFCIDVNDNGNIVYSLDKSDTPFSVKIDANTSKDEFLNNVAEINKEIEELKQMQNDLTISAVKQRTQYINDVNNMLQHEGLKPIEIKKYKNNEELINDIKKANFFNQKKFKDFMVENVPVKDWIIDVTSTRNNEGKYCVFEGGSFDDISKNLTLSKDEVLSTDKVFYRPSIKECRDIKNYYLEKEGKLTMKENKTEEKQMNEKQQVNENKKSYSEMTPVEKYMRKRQVLRYVGYNGMNLKNVDKELRNDKDVVKAAISNNGNAINYASLDLQNDPIILYLSAKKCPEVLKDKDMYLRTAVKNLIEEYSNKEKVLNKVQEYGMQLEYASDELKNDKDVVEKAITSCGAAIKFASKELKNDKDLAIKAVQQYGLALEYLPNELKNDKDVVLEAVSKHGAAIKFASNELKNDKEVIEKSVEQYPKAEKYVKKDTLKNDEKDFER